MLLADVNVNQILSKEILDFLAQSNMSFDAIKKLLLNKKPISAVQ